ncbi:adrenodoxin-like protein 2, mitochondrial [Drosophila guanche]|uniref:Blast:Adrenodoxin, mitochondrial n=1 Tax=Drosophila guanche TaxID=7266 RepID=A0A3B0K2C9_DROGU|nr:adrenodoxin-like protein 2, mitochondrial [Drosophila guanche]SPP87473.1 blast:Adrenodoxin%2C mitochondrial [Drosophila guanche]
MLVINTCRNTARLVQRSTWIRNSFPIIGPSISSRTFSLGLALRKQDVVNVTFVRANGTKIETSGKVGDSLLDVVVNNNVDLDGFGACEGTLTCSTCHLIFKTNDFEKLPDKPGDEEMDMLDLAYELTDTSRLGCQITLSKDMDGLEVHVPSTINDARAA